MSTSKKPLVSVGIPVFNGGKHLAKSLQSILDQTYSKLEIIIADDGSEDGSYEFLKKIAKNDSRIKLIQHAKRVGSINNFNSVLNKSSGEYFFWVAQDDIHDKRFVELLLKIMQENTNMSLAMCDYRNLHGNKKYKIYDTPASKLIDRTSSLKYFLKTDNLSLFYGLHKTKLLKKIGGYHTDFRPYFQSSDFLMIYKTLLSGTLGFIHHVMFYKRDTGLYTDEYTNLKQKPIKMLAKHIVRYALFPIHFIFDFMYGTVYLLQSDLHFNQKIQTEIRLITCTVRLFGRYIIKSLQGASILLRRTIGL